MSPFGSITPTAFALTDAFAHLGGDLRTHGPVALDTARHEASVNGVRVELTVTEFAILRTLFEARGRVLTRGQLIDSVRDADKHVTERTVDTHVRRIRAKLRPHRIDPIETVHGLGYKAAAPPT